MPTPYPPAIDLKDTPAMPLSHATPLTDDLELRARAHWLALDGLADALLAPALAEVLAEEAAEVLSGRAREYAAA